MKINKNEISFRKATLNDIDILTEFRIVFLKEAQGIPTLELEEHLIMTLKQYFKKSLESNSFVSWIAEYENKPIGFSGMVIREQPGNFEIPDGKTGYILNMFTIKEYRKNGIGSMLFQRLIDDAKCLGLDKIELHATPDGEPIYRKFGFTEPHDKPLEKILNKAKA
ncbi:MAG TPA: GNAT family N-acetyltransferase [Prolixibacteraceae bacterium]|nr:GNAT family N-acetyltransferase [Prolixibacteraceae bacterium]